MPITVLFKHKKKNCSYIIDKSTSLVEENWHFLQISKNVIPYSLNVSTMEDGRYRLLTNITICLGGDFSCKLKPGCKWIWSLPLRLSTGNFKITWCTLQCITQSSKALKYVLVPCELLKNSLRKQVKYCWVFFIQPNWKVYHWFFPSPTWEKLCKLIWKVLISNYRTLKFLTLIDICDIQIYNFMKTQKLWISYIWPWILYLLILVSNTGTVLGIS